MQALSVEAVRAALQSLPDSWKSQYEHEVGWPPYRVIFILIVTCCSFFNLPLGALEIPGFKLNHFDHLSDTVNL